MRIVDRATFLALPAGTVYAKWTPLEFGELAIKCGTCESGNDWVYQSLDMLEGDSPLDSLMDLDAGKEVAVDLEFTDRDGFYEPDMRFAVWSPEDVQALITRLEESMFSAHPAWLVARAEKLVADTTALVQDAPAAKAVRDEAQARLKKFLADAEKQKSAQ